MNIQTVINWLKSNVFIVIFSVVMIAALTSLPMIASGMNAELIKKVEDRAGKYRELTRFDKTSVTIVDRVPGGKDFTWTGLINEAFLNKYRQVSRSLDGEARKITDAALEHNRKGRNVIQTIDPMFPAPLPGKKEVTPWAYYQNLLQAYDDLILEVHAGIPPLVSEVAPLLESEETRFMNELIVKQSRAELNADESRELQRRLVDVRQQAYVDRAQEVYYYCSLDVLDVPHTSRNEIGMKALAELFQWQWRYWIAQDILRALAECNRVDASVLTGPVKRVVSMKVLDSPISGAAPAGGGGRSPAGGSRGNQSTPAPKPVDFKQEVKLDYTISFTGRSTNPLYDVQQIELVLIADPQRIFQVIDALSAYNFITVIDLNMEVDDAYAALRQGYVYDSAVAKFKLSLETIWLRAWMTQFMPEDLKAQLGIAPEHPATNN